jgi:hypothetical protein
MVSEPQFNRFSIALFDFEKAISYAEEAQKHLPNSLAHEALIFTAVISYYRPFSPNEKDKSAPAASRLKPSDFSPFSSDENEIHEKCEQLRNKALAHSEWSHNPTRLTADTGVIVSRPFNLLQHAPDLDALIRLARRLSQECHAIRANSVHQLER